jgi:protein-disulfide isomerase
MTRALHSWGPVVALGLLILMTPNLAAAAEALSAAEKAEVEAVIHDYILNNPEVLIDSLRRMEERQRQVAEQESGKAIAANRTALEQDPSSPVAGNAQGDVTVVEFFDYQCGYCKKALPVVQELLKTDPNVRWVFKDLPILGPDSVTAAQAAAAAWQIAPDKYLPFHVALMESRGELNEARVLELARKVGIDADRLKQAKADPAIAEKLSRTLELAKKLQINGTPAFVIGGQLVPGAIDIATMRQLVAAARSS